MNAPPINVPPLSHKCPTIKWCSIPIFLLRMLTSHFMCVQIFHMVDIDVPAGVGAPPLNTQLNRRYTGTGSLVGSVQRKNFHGRKLHKLVDFHGENICRLLAGATKEHHTPKFHGDVRNHHCTDVCGAHTTYEPHPYQKFCATVLGMQ